MAQGHGSCLSHGSLGRCSFAEHLTGEGTPYAGKEGDDTPWRGELVQTAQLA
jgi:propanediol dehydratase large subunit